MKSKQYNQGDNINGLIFIKELQPHISPSRKTKRATFRCVCGKEFDVIIRSVVSGNTKSCGCYGVQSRRQRFTTHGMRKHPLYRIWCSIKTRCTNTNRLDYKYYGGRGIKLSEEFTTDFLLFANYVSSLDDYDNRDGKQLTLDRIDNDGDYTRGNLRWVTRKVQTNNRSNSVKT